MIAILKTACLMGATYILKPAHVVAQPLAPIAWGASWGGGDTTENNNEDIAGVTLVSCGRAACAGLKTDGTVVAWGDSAKGGDVQGKDVTGVTQVACGGNACAGLKKDGSVVVWGNSGMGGDVQGKDVTGVAQLVCGGHACAGLKKDGSVVAWGSSTHGGDVQGKDVTGMAQISCGWYACAGLKSDGIVVAWGVSTNGGDVQGKDVTGVSQVVCGTFACAGLKSDGTVVTWGNSAAGGDVQGKDVTGVAQLVCGGYACAGLKKDGSVVAWGHSTYGGDVQGKDVTGMAQISCGWHACAGLKSDGLIVAWGSSTHGGDVKGQDVSGMVQLFCGGNACVALKTDGSVVAWGNTNGGELQGKVIMGANQITCGYNACAAWYDPDTAGGGGDPHFIAFGGIYFTWQGHCDLVMVKSKTYNDYNNSFEVHIRTTRIRKWSKIDTIALKVGQDVGEISSQDGMFILNGKEVNTVQNEKLTVKKSVKKMFSKSGKGIYLYDITLHTDKKLQVEVNTRTCMIYTKLSGNYEQHTEGILGSPHQIGLLSRNGDYIPTTNVNAFAETWQVGDMDSHLFNIARAPQFPSRCLYNMKKTTPSRFNRRLKEVHIVPTVDAVAACAAHHPGPLKKFCVDDVVMSGDLDSARDEFYE